MDGVELHAATAQPISLVIQDSVDPPSQISLHYWLGCKASQAIGCTDYNFDGLPQAEEYELKTVSSPEVRAGASTSSKPALTIRCWCMANVCPSSSVEKTHKTTSWPWVAALCALKDLGSSLCGTTR